jgi:hypothetical protein
MKATGDEAQAQMLAAKKAAKKLKKRLKPLLPVPLKRHQMLKRLPKQL